MRSGLLEGFGELDSQRRAGSWDQRRGRNAIAAALVATGLLLGCGSAAFAACSLWQLGAVIMGMVEATRRAGPVISGRAESRPLMPTGTLGSSEAQAPGIAPEKPPNVTEASKELGSNHGERAPTDPVSFEGIAEASEKAVPIGFGPESRLRRTACAGVFVYIVTVAEATPRFSAASLALGKTSPARFRRPGERLGEWEVVAITDDWSGLNPGVWLAKDDSICRAELAGNPSRIHVPPRPRSKPAASRRHPKKRRR
jgi:hypothetical protein